MITESVSIIIISILTALVLAVLAATTFAYSTNAKEEQLVPAPLAKDSYKLTNITRTKTPSIMSTTTIQKNQAWPIIGKKDPHSCAVNVCEDV